MEQLETFAQLEVFASMAPRRLHPARQAHSTQTTKERIDKIASHAHQESIVRQRVSGHLQEIAKVGIIVLKAQIL
jgi:hypothetical protein